MTKSEKKEKITNLFNDLINPDLSIMAEYNAKNLINEIKTIPFDIEFLATARMLINENIKDLSAYLSATQKPYPYNLLKPEPDLILLSLLSLVDKSLLD